jgi:hypothetical protein
MRCFDELCERSLLVHSTTNDSRSGNVLGRGRTMRMFKPINARFWGDYGSILISGYPIGEENGLLELYRTGPFVPPMTFPDEFVVTDSFRAELEKAFSGLQFKPVIKKRIVSMRWRWEQAEKTDEGIEKHLPPDCEPESYLLSRRHSEKASEAMGPLWQMVVKPVLQARFFRDADYNYTYYVKKSTWNGDHFLSLASRSTFPVVTEVAKDFLESHNAAEWLEFEEIHVVDELPPAEEKTTGKRDITD